MADDDLASRVTALEQQLSSLRQQLAESELGDWKARIDHLEVQLRLGEMGARDQIEPLVEQLRNRWLEARTQLDRVGGAAGGAVSGVGDSVRGAVDDLRRVLGETADRLTGR
jgi:hypothetical protein